MGYAIYDKKINKFPFTDDAPYTSEKSAKIDILEAISDKITYGDNNRAIYIFDNYIVKQAPIGFGKKAPVKKAPVKKSTQRPIGRPKRK